MKNSKKGDSCGCPLSYAPKKEKPGAKYAPGLKIFIDKMNQMVYNGSPYCDSMPSYAILSNMVILSQVWAVVKQKVRRI